MSDTTEVGTSEERQEERTAPTARLGAEVIRAAGCVLWRRPATGEDARVVVVHRPKWDDWSHPKGKLKAGEGPREAAVREVREETGMVCVLGEALSTARYHVDGQLKEVAYWVAEAVEGAFEPNHEVDEVSWLTPAEARTRLTQPRDVALLDEALRLSGAPDSGA